jgi:hypothetical protein
VAVIAVQDARAGLATVAFAAATGGGDTVAPGNGAAGWDNDQVVLLVRNADAAPKTVTVVGVGAVIVPAGDTAAIPVPGTAAPKAPTAVTYSAVTATTVAAVRV